MQDSPLARSPATAMRDLLRQLERQKTRPPARPTQLPPAAMATFVALTSTETAETAPVVVGAWTLAEDPVSGDLVATNADGTTRTIATKGTS
jgi:hypothetical protein